MEQTKSQRPTLIVRYERYSHNDTNLALMNSWLVDRDMPGISQSDIPDYGIMATLADQPIAMMFINRGECGTATIDGLVCDPELRANELRSEVLNGLVTECIKLAKSLNITKLIGFTVNDSTHKRAMSFNFVELPHKLFILKL